MKAVSETFLMSGSVMSRERSCLSLRRVLRNASHRSALGRTASSFRQHQEPCLGASISAIGPELDWSSLALPGPELRGLRTRRPEPRSGAVDPLQASNRTLAENGSGVDFSLGLADVRLLPRTNLTASFVED